jgi:hypothetical protein
VRRAVGALAVVLAAAAPLDSRSAAQSPTADVASRDVLLDHFAGRWVLTGTIAGQPMTHDVTVEWVLGDRYLRVHEVSRERDSAGAPVYQADVYIGRDPVTHERTCVWLDSTPGGVDSQSLGRAPAAATSGDSIPFLFRYIDGGRMHTTFIYDRARDVWAWRLDAEPAGNPDVRRPFARVTLTRVMSPAAPAAPRPAGGRSP